MLTFGTDGYRGIIADEFDFQTVGRLTQALALSLKKTKNSPYILIGYDTRFLSDKFASYAAEVALDAGLTVELADNFLPSPMLSYSITQKKADAGIVITASHNPYYYNGFKIKNSDGGSATPEQIGAIVPFLNKVNNLPKHNFYLKPTCKVFNPKDSYFSHLEKIIAKNNFKKAGLKIIADPMYGAGKSYFKELLEAYNLCVEEIHNDLNPGFGILQPEPMGDNMNDLKEKVLKTKADLGLALDGDADRSGAIDEKGNFINSHQIFALLLYHLVENKKMSGLVVKTFSTTSLVDIMAEKYGLEVIQTPIGFKHISDLMLTTDVLIGGEESGGIGIRSHIPERDGMLIGLMLIELMLYSGKPLSELINQIYNQFGQFAYDRVDKIVQPSLRETLYKNLDNCNVPKLINKNLRQLLNKDGYKYEFEDRSWLMFRLSGTESVVRIYAEANSPDEVSKLLTKGAHLVDNLTNA